MKFLKSIKFKMRLLIISSILFTASLIYTGISDLYVYSQERYLKNYVKELLTEVEEDFDSFEEARFWIEKNLNLTFYVLDSIEDLQSKVPSNLEKETILSVSDQKQLEMGNMVINKIPTLDLALDLYIFIKPIVKDGSIENLLFMHVPHNTFRGGEVIYPMATVLLVMLSAGVTILIHKKLFGNSLKQLKDIKLAANEISNGNFDIQMWQNSRDEIGEVTEAFNAMSTKLKNEQNRTKEFMEDFSHEIKTPLALVKSYNQALQNQVIQNEVEQQKCYHVIDREMNRLQKLIQNFLDFTKLEAKSVELVRQPIVFAQSVEEIMMKYELAFKEKNVKLDMKLDYDVIIMADEDRLEQVIQNIIQNAIRYVKDDPHIEIIMERKKGTCILAISDNGIGIGDEHLAVITNRFVRVNRVRSRKESGTGLGLSIVERLMDLHGGNMFIESQLGVGTTVKLEFPVLED